MALRNIVTEGDPILRKECREVKNVTDHIREVLDDMVDTMRDAEGVGLAGPQVGMLRRMFVAEPEPDRVYYMINPVITGKSGVFQTEEGCLSLEGVRPCTRYKEIEVDYLDQNFKKKHGKYTGWTAQIIQHEVEHCNGVVI